MMGNKGDERPADLAKISSAATYQGDGPLWEEWLACVERLGIEPDDAASKLQEAEAFWLAAWCFLNGRDELGMTAYERLLALVASPSPNDSGGPGPAFNYFRTFIYVVIALRRGEAARAFAALGPAYRKCGGSPSDEVLFAALQYLNGEIDCESVKKVAARFARSPVRLARAACAVALDVAGDSVGARNIFLGFDREFGHAMEIRRELSARFGASFDDAMKREPAIVPKRKRTPGFVLKRSRKETPHVFVPAGGSGPVCVVCTRPHRVWFSLDLTGAPLVAAKLSRWSTFLVTACLDCDAWMRRHELQVADDGSMSIVDVEPGPKSLPTSAYSDDSTRPIKPQFAKLTKAPRDLDERPLDGDCQLGGDPAWIQDSVEVTCPGCERDMVFVFRFSAPNGFDGSPEVAGGSGALYYFACGTCRRITHFAQWT